MFETPIDAWSVWLGVAAASVVVLGVAAGLPTEPTPDAATVADTVDVVAGGVHPATAEHGLTADRLYLSPSRIALRGPGGDATATFLFGPVTPVGDDDELRRVLAGEPPDRVFASRSAFESAASDARTGEPTWRRAPDRLRIRQVHWEGTRVTLVG